MKFMSVGLALIVTFYKSKLNCFDFYLRTGQKHQIITARKEYFHYQNYGTGFHCHNLYTTPGHVRKVKFLNIIHRKLQ